MINLNDIITEIINFYDKKKGGGGLGVGSGGNFVQSTIRTSWQKFGTVSSTHETTPIHTYT